MPQTQLNRERRKQQIIREILFISMTNQLPTIKLISKQIDMVISDHLRELLNELGDKDDLISIIPAKNEHGNELFYYYPKQDEIKRHYGLAWYETVMRGIDKRINKLTPKN